MWQGIGYTIPQQIGTQPGVGPNANGFAFRFVKDLDSWFEASNVSVADYTDLAVSCWIKIDSDFFVDFTPPAPGEPDPPFQFKHILDKYDFTGGIPRGYRLYLEKKYNSQSESTARRLIWQIGFGGNTNPNQAKLLMDITSLSANTVYLVQASVDGTIMDLKLIGDGVQLSSSLTANEPMDPSTTRLVIGNANPNSTAAEFEGDIDEVAIWEKVIVTDNGIEEVFDWPNNKNLNTNTNYGQPDLWWQMGENASIVVVNNQDEYELPNIGTYNSTVSSLTGTGTIDKRITPGLPNELYNN